MGLSTPEDETPDPADAAVLGKVRRLMALSLLFTALALAAVFIVIGYRVFTSGKSGGAPAAASVALPKGARVIATAVADGRLIVTIEVAGAVEVRLFDLATLAPRGTLRLAPAP
jgi:hypothetical protein